MGVRRTALDPTFLEDFACAFQAGTAGGGHAQIVLQRLEIRAAAGGGNRDVAIRDSVADTNNHGLEF